MSVRKNWLFQDMLIKLITESLLMFLVLLQGWGTKTVMQVSRAGIQETDTTFGESWNFSSSKVYANKKWAEDTL